MNHANQGKGILAGLIAGVFWGTPFLVPMLLSSFTALEITFGRFFFFGIVSFIFFPRIIRLWQKLSWLDLAKVFVLSASGFWLYSLVLFYGVQLTGGVISALIIGCLPLTITLFSNPRFNSTLWLGLSLILIGLLCLLVWPLITNHAALNGFHINTIGIVAVFIALILWTYFSIQNSRFMRDHIQIKSLDYSSLIGFVNLICMLPLFALLHGFSTLLINPHVWSYLFWCAVLGLGASWLANIFWAYSAKICPSSIVGSLIVSETVFGLIYGFLFEKRLPHMNEAIAIMVLIAGVILSIHSQMKKSDKA